MLLKLLFIILSTYTCVKIENTFKHEVLERLGAHLGARLFATRGGRIFEGDEVWLTHTSGMLNI